MQEGISFTDTPKVAGKRYFILDFNNLSSGENEPVYEDLGGIKAFSCSSNLLLKMYVFTYNN